jgi:hypothetical protein
VRCGGHEYNSIFIIDFIEKTPRSDAIPPGSRIEISEFFDIRPIMRMLTQLGVYEITKFFSNFAPTGS